MNVHPMRTNAVTLRVVNESGSDALGAVVTSMRGSTPIMKSVQSAWSIMAANDPRVHIGLGEQKEISDVAVLWVDGTTTNFGTFKQGFHTLQKPK
jgi:hypothetical protein